MPFDPSAFGRQGVARHVDGDFPCASVINGDGGCVEVRCRDVGVPGVDMDVSHTADGTIVDVRSPSHRFWAAASPALRTRANPRASAAVHPHSDLWDTPAALATMGLVREGEGAAAFIWWNRIGRKDVGGRVEIAGCVASLPVPTCNHTDLFIHDGTFFLLSRSGGDVPHEAPAPSATKECHRRR